MGFLDVVKEVGAWSREFGKKLKDGVTSLARGVGSWFGLEQIVDDFVTAVHNTDPAKLTADVAKQIAEAQKILEQAASKYNLDVSKLTDKLNGLSNIVDSSITKQAKSQEAKKLRDEMETLNQKQSSITAKANYALNLANAQLYKNPTERTTEASKDIDKKINNTLNELRKEV